MDRSLELSEISLVPTQTNDGDKNLGSPNFGVTNFGIMSYPIMISPRIDLIDSKNLKGLIELGFNVVIPKEVPMQDRLQMCTSMFTSFTLQEIPQVLSQLKTLRGTGSPVFVYVESGLNGHNSDILYKASLLKSVGATIMAGPIINPKAYELYAKAGVDIVRVGNYLDQDERSPKIGMTYPIVTMLSEISAIKQKFGGGPTPKISIEGYAEDGEDILKCIALGADYVTICGKFGRYIESAGQKFERIINHMGENSYKPFTEAITEDTLKKHTLFRQINGTWVSILGSVRTYLKSIQKDFKYAFEMTNSKNWEEFKKNIGIIY